MQYKNYTFKKKGPKSGFFLLWCNFKQFLKKHFNNLKSLLFSWKITFMLATEEPLFFNECR